MAYAATSELLSDGPVENIFNAESNILLRASMGVAAIGGILALDLGSQFAFWRKYSTEVILDGSDRGVNADRRWLGYGGLGRQDALFLADELGGTLPGAIDSLSYSHFGVTDKRIGRPLAEYYGDHYSGGNKSDLRQNIIAHSAGFPTALMGIKWCLDNGMYVPPIDTLLAISSPVDGEQTYKKGFVKIAKRYPYPGGSISKTFIEFYQRQEQEQDKLRSLGKSAYLAVRHSYSECSPALWTSQVRLLSGGPYQPDAFRGIITPDTRIMHFGDVNDKTVNIPAARQALIEFAKPYGAEVIIEDTPGFGHANVPETAGLIRRQYAVAA